MDFKLKNVVGNKGFVSYRNDNPNSVNEFIVESELKFQNLDTSIKHFYLSANDGNDNNDGLTLGTAVSTTEKIVELISGIWFRPVVINVYSGEYNLDPLTTGKGINFLAASMGASLHWIGHDKTILTTGSIQAGSTTYILKTSDIGSTNYSGYELEFTNGTFNNYRKTIQQTTSGSVTFGAPYSTTPSTNDTFQIFEPAAVFKRNTASSPAALVVTIPFGISTGQNGGAESSRIQKSIYSVTNILFQNASPTYSGIRLSFGSEFALFGVMFRDFTLIKFTGNGSTGEFAGWNGFKTASSLQYSSTDPIAVTLGLLSGTLATGVFFGYGISTDPNLASSIYHDNGVAQFGGCVTDIIGQIDSSWLWTVGEYSRVYHETTYNSYCYIQFGAKIGGNSFGLYVTNNSHVDAITINAVISGSPNAITCINNGVVNLGGSATIVSGSVYSIRARQGSVYFTNSTILSGNIAFGEDSSLSSTILNMKTGVTASAILSASAFASAGDSYSSGVATVYRKN